MKTSVASSTWKSRKSQWRCYRRFCTTFQLTPLPCSDDQLSLYGSFLYKYLSHSSMLVYLQAVIFASKLSACTPPSLNFPSVKMVLEGSRRTGKPVGHGAIPVTITTLKELFPNVDLSRRAECVLWASCLLMFFTLLRISHVVDSTHTLLVKDVISHDWGLMLTVRSSKTSKGFNPIKLPLCKIPDKRFCPVFWISKMLKVAKVDPESGLFSTLLGRRFTYSCFRKGLDGLSAKAGLSEKFSGHSFRKGGACYLMSLGVPISQVQERGNWKSLCVLRYLSLPVSDRIRVEQGLASMFM